MDMSNNKSVMSLWLVWLWFVSVSHWIWSLVSWDFNNLIILRCERVIFSFSCVAKFSRCFLRFHSWSSVEASACLSVCCKTCCWAHTGWRGWIFKEFKAASDGRFKLTLNELGVKNCFNAITLSSFELFVLSGTTDLPTHRTGRFGGGGGPGSWSEMSATGETSCTLLFLFYFVLPECACVLSFPQGAACSAYRVNRKMPVPPPPPPPGPPPPPTLALVSGRGLIHCIITDFCAVSFSLLGSE